MRIIPSRARLAGLGLTFAAIVILALAVVVLIDQDEESRVRREVVVAQRVKDDLYALRGYLVELRFAARLGARTGDRAAFRNIDKRALDVERALATLDALPADNAQPSGLAQVATAARLLAMNARSVSGTRAAHGTEAALALAEQVELLTNEATESLDRAIAQQTQRIDDRTEAQLEVGDRLRRYISGLVVLAVAVLGTLFAAYRRAQLRERAAQRKVEQLAHFDSVTGLPNRTLLADRLGQALSRARRDRSGVAVLLFDLDGFKAVNDTWGHAAGDRVLAEVARRSRGAVRASDTVGRLGGDEFLAILPEASLDGALAVAEKLREALAAPYPLEGATAHLSASVGVSLFPDHGDDGEALQRTADAALYQAKREGRNRTVAAGMPAPAGVMNAA
ncbi:MAG TPA: diguanylate cyclase [Usitatibacter sp.]|nr:diguanylate cyclase [Usitatibacter sp.]